MTFNINFSNIIVTCLFILFTFVSFSIAQDGTPSPTPNPSPTPSERERKLEEEKRIKTLEKEIAEAEKAIREARPQPKSTPLEGDTTISEVKIESNLVTYRAVSNSLNKIAEIINDKAKDAEIIFFYSPQDINNLDYYRATKGDVEKQLDNFTNRYIKLKESYCANLGCEFTVGKFQLENTLESVFPTQRVLADTINSVTTTTAESSPTSTIAANILDPISAGVSALGFVTDLLAVFRTDTTITGQDVSVEEDSMIAGISRIFKDNSLTLYYPQKYFPATDNQTVLNSNILKMITNIDVEKKAAEETVFKYQFVITAATANQNAERNRLLKKIESIDKYIAELEVDRAKQDTLAKKKKIQVEIKRNEKSKEPIESQIKEIDRGLLILGIAKFHMDKLQELNNEARQFLNDFSTGDKEKPSKLLSFLKAERLSNVLKNLKKDKKYYWLELDAVSAGGNTRTRKNLILYFTGAKVDHSGGVIISWKLYNEDGSIKYSGVDNRYEGYKSSKSIEIVSNSKDKDPANKNQK